MTYVIHYPPNTKDQQAIKGRYSIFFLCKCGKVHHFDKIADHFPWVTTSCGRNVVLQVTK